MQILIMIKNQLKLLFNDRISIFIVIVAPLVFTGLILYSSSSNNNKTNIYLADNDNSKASKQLISMIKEHQDLNVILLPENDIRNKIEDNYISNGAVIENGFEENLKNSKALGVKLIENYDNIDGQNLYETILTEENTLEKITLDSKNISNVLKIDNDEVSKNLINKVNDDSSIVFSYKTINASQKTEDKIGETLIRYLVMFLWLVVIQGFRTLVDEKENNIFNRIKGTPTSYWKYLISKIVATYILGLIVVALILVIGKYGFKAGIVNNVFAEISIFAIYLFAIIGIVMIFVPFIKNHQTFTILGSVFMALTGMLGGSFFPMDELTIPKEIQIISKFMPETWGIKALKDIIFNNAVLSSQMQSVIILFFIGVLGSLISIMLININMKAKKIF